MNGAYDLIIQIYRYAGNFDTVIFALPVIILTIMIYWLARLVWHKRKFGKDFKAIRRKARLNELIRLLAVCWFSALLCLTLTPTEFWMHLWMSAVGGGDTFESFFPGRFGEIYLVPAILMYISEGDSGLSLLTEIITDHQMMLNILLFVPLGAVMPFICGKADFFRTVLAGFSLSMSIEFVQFFLGRSCETDDLICNTLGAAAGYLLFLLIKKLFPAFTEKGRLSAKSIYTAAG